MSEFDDLQADLDRARDATRAARAEAARLKRQLARLKRTQRERQRVKRGQTPETGAAVGDRLPAQIAALEREIEQQRVGLATARALALVSGATYVARGFSGVPEHMANLIAGGISHRGFSLIDVFSPCVTYNKLNTYPWFKERVYKLEDEASYDSNNAEAAVQRSFEWGDRIPIGLFYQDEQPTYEDSEPAFKEGPLVHQKLGLERGTFDELMQEFI